MTQETEQFLIRMIETCEDAGMRKAFAERLAARARVGKGEGERDDSEPFLLVDQDFMDDWYAQVIQNRPDQNIYKEGLIGAYEDLCTRIGSKKTRIDSTAVKIRMRAQAKPVEVGELEPIIKEAATHRGALGPICSLGSLDAWNIGCAILAKYNVTEKE